MNGIDLEVGTRLDLDEYDAVALGGYKVDFKMPLPGVTLNHRVTLHEKILVGHLFAPFPKFVMLCHVMLMLIKGKHRNNYPIICAFSIDLIEA